MPETTVIVNTSPLLYLHQVGHLQLIQLLYGKIIVPPAVRQELEVGKMQGVDVPEINSVEWIQIRPVVSAALIPAVIDLGQGEAEVLALGLETNNRLLIFDDRLARRIAALYRLVRGAKPKTFTGIRIHEIGSAVTLNNHILSEGFLVPMN